MVFALHLLRGSADESAGRNEGWHRVDAGCGHCVSILTWHLGASLFWPLTCAIPMASLAHQGPRRRAAGIQTVRHRLCGRSTQHLEQPGIGAGAPVHKSGSRRDILVADGLGWMVWRHRASGSAVGSGCSVTCASQITSPVGLHTAVRPRSAAIAGIEPGRVPPW